MKDAAFSLPIFTTATDDKAIYRYYDKLVPSIQFHISLSYLITLITFNFLKI
jgi:hypothetical protein